VNAQLLAQKAYAPTAPQVRSDRSIEHSVFSKATYRLRETEHNAKTNYPAFVTALYENQKLWTLVAMDVADGDNQLTQELRAQIFYLAEFTAVHTAKVLRNEATAAPLIEVNTSIMRGLRPEGVTN
jgi:flagellar protein FlaF